MGLILCAGKRDERIELLELDRSGIHVAEYLTELPSKKVLQEKLHSAIKRARKRLGNTPNKKEKRMISFYRWIKAEEGPEKNSVIYTDTDGNQLTRFWKAYEEQPAAEASTRSWRNNNPGNHAIGDFARRNGAIGFAGKIPNEEGKEFWFAVYPDYETGRKAQALRLKEGTMYIDSTLNAFVRIYLGIKKGLPDTQAVLD